MRIFKFGGASVKNAEAVKNVGRIMSDYKDEKIVVVISAMGKTTNALEAVWDAYLKQNGEAEAQLELVKESHFAYAKELFEDEKHPIFNDLNDTFVEIHWILEDEPAETQDYLYDQIVSIGEFLSTRIVSAYLNEVGIKNTWLDVRDCIKTDNSYREGRVDWEATQSHINRVIPPLLDKGIVVTQGFIGCTSENFTTTLGREGSDYTGAIFAYSLDAEEVNVWKDVPGILSADPKRFEDAVKIQELSYYDAIEMTYYGASVIHPKTIKPLYMKEIPLRVRSFVDAGEQGTLIHKTKEEIDLPAVIIVKPNQVLLSVFTKDFSFIREDNLSQIYEAFARFRIKTNLTQNAAVSFSACIDNNPRRVQKLLDELGQKYKLQFNEDLTLITIRHYDSESIAKHLGQKEILLEQKSRQTIQVVVR